MTAPIDIANLALSYCEMAPIASFDEQSNPARVFRAGFDLLRDALQRQYRWNFTRRYTTLATSATQPAFEYEYAYALPDDFLRLELAGSLTTGVLPTEVGTPAPALATTISLPGVDLNDFRNGRSQDYRIVGVQLYAHIPPPCAIIYAARVTDANQFDTAFIETFACWLAWKLGPRLNASLAKKRDLKEDFTISLRAAIAAKSVENAPRTIADDTWELSRIAN